MGVPFGDASVFVLVYCCSSCRLWLVIWYVGFYICAFISIFWIGRLCGSCVGDSIRGSGSVFCCVYLL